MIKRRYKIKAQDLTLNCFYSYWLLMLASKFLKQNEITRPFRVRVS